MKQTIYSIAGLALVSLLAGCRSAKTETVAKPVTQEQYVSSPPVIIYKTRKDYSQLVPVSMNSDRTKITSYPAPSDIIDGGTFPLPTPLADGFLLDNRGITATVAFLTYTYAEYSQLPSAPSVQELMKHIADKYPLTEMYECGRKAGYKEIVPELNQLIEEGLPGCKKVKIMAPVLLRP